MCRGDGPYCYRGDCDPVPRDGGGADHPANCEREGRQADDPRTDEWREQRKEGGAMTRFGTKRIGVLALAVASVTALAACSGSSNSTTSGTTTPTAPPGETTHPVSIGAIPAAGTPSGTAGTITYALPPGAVPNWILPMPTAASNSVYNIYNFEWQLWSPMYYE